MHRNVKIARVTVFGLAAIGFIGASLLPQTTTKSYATVISQGPPQTITLTGVVRDFKEYTVPGGHPDFERTPTNGFAHYSANISQNLGADGKPVFLGGGKKVKTEWKDSSNRNICYALFNAALGDHIGAWGAADTGGVQSADSFNKWYNDVPGTNMSAPLTLTFNRQADGTYLFDDKLDPQYSSLSGFFPIEGQLFGNPGGTPNRNFHFTFELHTTFKYDSAANQIFRFIGDDDVFVFINGKLVIDLGGVHSAVDQFVALNRLGLTNGQSYPLDFFGAERHRTQSNFRIQTNIQLQPVQPPSVTSAFD